MSYSQSKWCSNISEVKSPLKTSDLFDLEKKTYRCTEPLKSAQNGMKTFSQKWDENEFPLEKWFFVETKDRTWKYVALPRPCIQYLPVLQDNKRVIAFLESFQGNSEPCSVHFILCQRINWVYRVQTSHFGYTPLTRFQLLIYSLGTDITQLIKERVWRVSLYCFLKPLAVLHVVLLFIFVVQFMTIVKLATINLFMLRRGLIY